MSHLSFSKEYIDSCTAVALQTVIEFGAKEICMIGYDGYKGQILSEKEMDLTRENRTLFLTFTEYTSKRIISLTPTLYSELQIQSIYQSL